MGNIIEIGTLYENTCPFEDYGCESEDFLSLEEALGKDMLIHAVKAFENDKGPGVYILVYTEGRFRYLCTHSVTITAKLTTDKVKEILSDDTDDTIKVRFVRRKSKKSDRMGYDIE